MTVRLFAGWDFAKEDVHRADFARHGYGHQPCREKGKALWKSTS